MFGKRNLKRSLKNFKKPSWIIRPPLRFTSSHFMTHSLSVDVSVSKSQSSIYYLQTLSVFTSPPAGRVVTQSKDGDPGSAVNELRLQSRGIIMCWPAGRFHVVYLCLPRRLVLPHCPSIAVSLFSSFVSLVINFSSLSSIFLLNLKCIRILSQLIYQLIWFLWAIWVEWKDTARDAIMVYLF